MSSSYVGKIIFTGWMHMNAPQICNYSGKKWKTMKFLRRRWEKMSDTMNAASILMVNLLKLMKKYLFFSFKITKPKYSIYSIYSTFKLNLKSKKHWCTFYSFCKSLKIIFIYKKDTSPSCATFTKCSRKTY